MALDDLPGKLETPARDEIATGYRRDYKLVSPESDTSDGSQPDVQAKTLAVTLLPVYSNGVLIANAINEDAATGVRLDRVGARYGVTRPKAKGASGYVSVSAAEGGGTIQAGDELKNRQSGKRYEAAETKFVNDGTPIRVRGKDTGPATNLEPGVSLQWSNPRPGVGPLATVQDDGEGNGLIGGADVADDASFLLVIQEARRNPPNADNDAMVQRTVSETPDVAVQQCFTYPCWLGPGTLAYAFTLATPTNGNPESRIPIPAQCTSTLAWLTSQLPSDDSYFVAQIVKFAASVSFRVEWEAGALGWADAAPWPAFAPDGLAPGSAGAIVVTSQFSATQFTLGTDNGDYTGVIQPQVGQTIGFFDWIGALKFRAKRIKAITGTGPWVIETDLVVSDQTYSPLFGQRAMPWADSLVDLVTPVLKYFNQLGPGEMFDTFPSDGRRRRRMPRAPKKYPQMVTSSLETPIRALGSISSADLLPGPGVGIMPPTGTPGLTVNMFTLGDLCAFP